MTQLIIDFLLLYSEFCFKITSVVNLGISFNFLFMIAVKNFDLHFFFLICILNL